MMIKRTIKKLLRLFKKVRIQVKSLMFVIICLFYSTYYNNMEQEKTTEKLLRLFKKALNQVNQVKKGLMFFIICLFYSTYYDNIEQEKTTEKLLRLFKKALNQVKKSLMFIYRGLFQSTYYNKIKQTIENLLILLNEALHQVERILMIITIILLMRLSVLIYVFVNLLSPLVWLLLGNFLLIAAMCWAIFKLIYLYLELVLNFLLRPFFQIAANFFYNLTRIKIEDPNLHTKIWRDWTVIKIILMVTLILKIFSAL